MVGRIASSLVLYNDSDLVAPDGDLRTCAIWTDLTVESFKQVNCVKAFFLTKALGLHIVT